MTQFAMEESHYRNSDRGIVDQLTRRSFIQITRHLYEEPDALNLVIAASDGAVDNQLKFRDERAGDTIAAALASLPGGS